MAIGTLFVAVTLIILAAALAFMEIATKLNIHNFDGTIINILSIPIMLWIGPPFLIGIFVSFL